MYAVGHSPRDGRCKAYVFPHDRDHEAVDITDAGMHVRPAPPGIQPTDIELSRLGSPPLTDGKPAEVPASADGWAALARRVFEGRACASVRSGLKLWIAGDVTLTTVTAAGADAEVVHRFTRDDFRMVAGTFHPWGQVGPCVCGSGRQYIACHIPRWRPLPCLCESGETLGECCALDAGEAADLLDEHPDLRDLPTAPVPA